MTNTLQVADTEGDGTHVPAAASMTRREARARERAAEAAAQAQAPTAELPTRRSSRAAEKATPLPTTPHRQVSARRAPARVQSAAAPRPAASRSTGPSKALVRTRRFSVLGVMLFVGATIVSTSVPANAYFVDSPEKSAVKLAVAAVSGTTVGGTTTPQAQVFVASGATAAEQIGRDGYSVTNPVIQSTGTSPASASSSTGAVRWPFPTAVPISSGFGGRQVANCSFCSTFHQGLDFTPGSGTPIEIVADGVVSKVDQGSGALGYNVWIDHVINGQKVTTVYAHMIAGSIRVSQGQSVKGGQIVGEVGSTGNSTGAHLHFEVHLSGIPVDPFPWLVANAGAE